MHIECSVPMKVILARPGYSSHSGIDVRHDVPRRDFRSCGLEMYFFPETKK